MGITRPLAASAMLCATVWLIAGCPMENTDFVAGIPLPPGATGEESGAAADARDSGADQSEAPPGESAPSRAKPGSGIIAPAPDASTSEDFNLPKPHVPPAAPTPFGTWLLEEGAMLPSLIANVDVTGLVLSESGIGRVFLLDRETNARDCVRAMNLYDGDTLVLDFSLEANLALAPDRTFFFPVVFVDADTLGVADETGLIAFFSRQTALPADIICNELEINERFDGLPAPNFFSDLVLFDGDLVYNSTTGGGQIERFDLDTESIGAPLGATSGRLVQTTQGVHFWTHCACGGSPDAFRRNLTTVFDTVNSQTELGGFITIRAMAYVPATDRLWIHGRAQATGRASFSIVNTNPEPDQLVNTLPFNRDLRALAFDGVDLWGIVNIASQSVVRIDAASGRAIESFQVPDEQVTWGGLVFDATDMYLLGVDANNEGVIVRSPRRTTAGSLGNRTGDEQRPSFR